MKLTKILAGLLFLLAIGLGIGAWLLGRDSARAVAPAAATAKAPKVASAPVAQFPVVVAAKPIAAGQRLTPDDLKIVQMPAAVAHGFTATDAVLGYTTVIALPAGAPLFEQHLLNGLALQLESGQRAVSVAVNEAMAAGHYLRPGNFVDVFFTLDSKSEQAGVDTQTRLLLARSRVLAYGAASVENPPPSAAQRKEQQAKESTANARRGSGQSEGSGTRSDKASTAVLAVPLEDVQRLTLAEKYGRLTLALRHPDDTALPDASLFAALPTALRPAPARLKKGEPLPAADQAYAGLRLKDLATAGEAKNTSRAPAAVRAPGTQRASQPARAQTVELHQGTAVQTVRY